MKDHLRGVNIHHRDVAAENFSDADGLESSLHGELFLSVGSEKRQFVADFQAVAIGEGARKQNGIGLSEEHQRIGNLRLRLVELVVAQLVVARGVHAQDQQIAFVRECCLHHDLDHGFGHLHARRGAHGIEYFFGESGFPGGDFQCGFARQFFNGGAQGIQQSGIAGADREKYRDAERDAQSGQRHAQPVGSPLLESDEPHRAEH